MSIKGQPIIVVKKKKIMHAGHHGGAWKVAYADFVTAMMAFFLVMWLVNQSPQAKQAVGGYFRDPGVFDSQSGQGVLPGGRGVDPSAATSSTRVEDAQAVLEAAVQEIQGRLASNPAFESLRHQVEFTVTPEGLRIDLVDEAKSSFFDSGSAVLRGEAEQILGVIGRQLTSLAHDVVIEGHTDSQKYSSPEGYSNWELSADRANAARRAMERQGFPPKLVASVRGHADRLLRVRDKPTDPTNRRVSIVVRNAPVPSG